MSNLPTFTASSEQPIQLSQQINPVLTQDNYLMWKSQVLPLLRGHGLTAFVDGSKSPPPEKIQVGYGENLPNQAFNQWLQQDQLILGWMFRSILPPILAQVIDCESSHQLWQRLQKMYSTQSDLSGHGRFHPHPSFLAGESSTAPSASQNTFSNSTSNQGRGSFSGKAKGKGRGSGSNTDKSIQCQICLKWGHDAGKCYRRFDNLYSDEPLNTLQECKYAFQEVDPDAHADYVSCISFSPNAWPPVFVSGSWDRTVKVWNATNLKLRYTLRGHKGRVKAVAISPDGSLCASGGDSCVILLWDLAEGRRLYTLDAGAHIHALCFCPNKYWLAVCAETSVQIWDLESKVMRDFKPDDCPRKWNNHYCTRLDWSADGNTLFTGYSDGAIRVWRVAGGNY